MYTKAKKMYPKKVGVKNLKNTNELQNNAKKIKK